MRSIDWSSDVCSSDLLTAKKERPFDKLRANGLKESSCLCTFVRTACSDRGIQPITCLKRLVVFVALAIATLLLGFGIRTGFASSVDTKLSLLLALRAGEGCNALIAFMQGVSWLGGGIPRWLLALLLAALLWHSAGRRSALLLAGTAAAANLASTLPQHLLDRTPPHLIPHPP